MITSSPATTFSIRADKWVLAAEILVTCILFTSLPYTLTRLSRLLIIAPWSEALVTVTQEKLGLRAKGRGFDKHLSVEKDYTRELRHYHLNGL